MINRIVTKEDIEWAEAKATHHKEGPRFHHGMRIDGPFRGYVGDSVLKRRFPAFRHEDKSDYDFIYWGPKHYPLKIENKTYSSDKYPEPHFSVNVYKKDYDRVCDLYTHVCLAKDLSWAVIIGYIWRDHFDRRKRLLRSGHTTPNGFEIPADVYCVYINQLDGQFKGGDQW